jgi:hypothetical protein
LTPQSMQHQLSGVLPLNIVVIEPGLWHQRLSKSCFRGQRAVTPCHSRGAAR